MKKTAKTKQPVPLEEDEQIAFVEWLETLDLTFSAINPNPGKQSYGTQAKNKRLGLRAGLPDFLIAIPNKYLIFVEMKRTKGSSTSQAQKDWIDTLNTIPNVECRVCKGCSEAIKFIREII